MTENLHSYIVCLNFAAPGILIVGCYIAPDEASAAALATLEAAKKMQRLDEIPPLMNCIVSEESAESLRHRLRIIEGGKPGGEVVSLVRSIEEGVDKIRESDRELARILDPPESALFGAHVDYAAKAGVPKDPPAPAPFIFPPAWLDGKFTLYGEEFGPLPPVA